MRIQPYSFDSYSSSGSYSSTAANTKPAPYAYSTGPSASAHPAANPNRAVCKGMEQMQRD
jgi:hypothetical protein